MSSGPIPPDQIWQYVRTVRRRVLAADRRVASFGSGLVYHYTSLPTLEAATASGCFANLRASSAFFMNDTREYVYGKAVIDRRMDNLLGGSAGWREDVLSEIRIRVRSASPRVYCVCFSLQDDDLSQWRGYGDMGRGCTLCLDRAELEQHVDGIGCWVTYDPSRQRRVATELLSDYLDAMSALTGASAAAVPAVAQAFADLYPSLCMLFKDGSFRAEREYRVIYSPSGPSGALPELFMSKGSRIVPYVELKLAGPVVVPLRAVRLGPSASDDRNKAAISAMLAARGVALPGGSPVPVLPSRIPFVPT